jgi:hypothetical protein
MSAWDEIIIEMWERAIRIALPPAVASVIREASENYVEQALEESSAWSILEAQLNPDLTKPVPGLTKKELEVIQMVQPVQSKSGGSGEIAMLSPKNWDRIKRELEANREYYQWKLQGQGDMQQVIQKIDHALATEMGAARSQPAGQSQQLPGKPADITPSVQGTDVFQSPPSAFSPKTGHGSSASAESPPPKAAETSAQRRARVAKQDMEMMGAKTPEDVKRMTQAGKMQVK